MKVLQAVTDCAGFCLGIEPTGNRVLRPAVFTVDTFSAGQGQVTVYLDHPDGTREEVGSLSGGSRPVRRLFL